MPHSSRRAAPRLLGAVAFSNASDGILRLAIPLLVLADHHSASDAALTATAAMAPWLAFSIPVGAWLDRARPALLNRGANIARGSMLLAVVGAATSRPLPVSLWVAVAFLVGVAEVVADLATQVIAPGVVSDRGLPTLNAQISGTQLVANNFVGPAIGGIAVAHLSEEALVPAAIMYFLAAVVLPAGQQATATAGAQKSPRGAGVSDGVRYFGSRRDLITLAGVVGAMNLTSAVVGSVLPGFGVEVAGLDAATFGLVVGVGGLGAIPGTIVAPRLLRRFGTDRLVSMAVATIALAPVVLIASPTAAAIATVVFAGAFATPICAVAIVTHRQRTTPFHLLGRTNSIFQTAGLGAATAGGAIATLGINHATYRATFAVAVAASAIAWLAIHTTTLHQHRQRPQRL